MSTPTPVANLYAHSCESVVNLSYYLIFVTIIANLLRTCVYTLANPSRTWLHILANPLRTCSHILANRCCEPVCAFFANLCESVANPSANLPYIPVYASRTLANLRESTVYPSMDSVTSAVPKAWAGGPTEEATGPLHPSRGRERGRAQHGTRLLAAQGETTTTQCELGRG